MADLAPPTVKPEDTGVHELESHNEGTTKTSTSSKTDSGSSHDTPGGLPIPKTVVEKVEPENPSHGEVPGTAAYDIRTEDAEPDEVRVAPEVTRTNLEDLPTTSSHRYEQSPEGDLDGANESTTRVLESTGGSLAREIDNTEESETVEATIEEEDAHADDDFDDFDEFAEGAEGDDDAFGDFDEAEDEAFEDTRPEPILETASIKAMPAYQPRILDFGTLEPPQDIDEAIRPYLKDILPGYGTGEDDEPVDMSEINPAFLTERSQSLWAQLVAPPPLQPPDWIRSRIRRLFLVSLGVPVDLDEILPASKQKKLVLPSVHIDDRRASLRATDVSELAASGLVERMKEENAVIAATGEAGRPSLSARPVKPGSELDLNAARLLCSTTDVAMHGFADNELEQHIARLERFAQSAEQMLQHWTKQRDSALGDKKAFEEVIENLVKHAQKIRK